MPVPPERPTACIFDLDGTLVDSLRDIGEAVNECLELLGLAAYPLERFRYMVGDGVPMLCQRAIGRSHPHLVGRLVELTRARYRTRPLRHTVPYAGVRELLSRLRASEVRLAVLSNKPHDMTSRIIRAFWPGGVFGAIYGYQNDELRKPDPTCALRICGELGVEPARTWLIGDTPTDVQTARSGGMTCIATTWGFRTAEELRAAGAEWIVAHPDEIG
jgi:phosphoglycolate phosphatase